MKFMSTEDVSNQEKVEPKEAPIKEPVPVLEVNNRYSKIKLTEEEISMSNKILLSEEEKNAPLKQLAEKYGLTISGASYMRTKGYRTEKNPEFVSKEKINQEKRNETEKFLKEVTPLEVNSIETILGNSTEQALIKEVVFKYDTYKYNDKFKIYQKKFKLLNNEELSYGDIYMLNKMIENKIFRDESGQLMMFYKNKFIPFRPTYFFDGQKLSLVYRGDPSQNKEIKTSAVSLETLSPKIFKKGIFREEDFGKRIVGSAVYEISGPHERKLSHSTPTVFLSNQNGSAKYFLGRDKFIGTDKKINHETVRVNLLDNNTAAVTDLINGRKMILYTFPLISKEQYEKKKEEITKKIETGEIVGKNVNNYILVGASELSSKLVPYKITDYIKENENEPTVEYAERISKLSDTTYVLGNFKSFMSEAGIAANNYSWREQLILSEALTSIGNKDKIINFGRTFKKDGLRTFLSVEKGGFKMGKEIMELSNLLPKEIAKNIFEGYSNLIDEAAKLEQNMSSLEKIEGVSKELVEKIPVQIYEALLQRTKDILLSANILAHKKELDGLNVLSVREATDGVTLILKILNDLNLKENFSFKEINRTEQNFKYEIFDKTTGYKYNLKIFLRPKAEKTAQARINIELSFDTDSPNTRLQNAFINKVESHTQNKIMNGSVLRIGIDREERNGGQVSLDIGRAAHSDNELTRTGDILGNLLSLSSLQGNHTTESFDKRFAEEENFAQIVKLFENYLMN